MLSLNSLLKALIVAAVVSKVHCDVLKGTDDVDSSNSSLVGESGVLIEPVSGANVIQLFGGNDIQVKGGLGTDLIDAGAGDDSQIDAGAGEDLILAGEGNDVQIYGDAGNDALFGGAGDDELFGGSGNDFLQGGEGNDILHGNGGKNAFGFRLDYGNDTIVDFNSSLDTIIYPGSQEEEDLLVDVKGSDTIVTIGSTRVRIIGQQLQKADITFEIYDEKKDDDDDSFLVQLIGPIVGGVLVIFFTVWRYAAPQTYPCRKGGPESRIATV